MEQADPASTAHIPDTVDAEASAPAVVDAGAALRTGERVELHSLSAKPELNGKSAKVKGYITASGRYSVVPVGLESAIGIKRANLKQDTAARLPSAEEVDDESEYPLADVLAVLDVRSFLDDWESLAKLPLKMREAAKSDGDLGLSR